jgi:predicted enzyme related to lactoylglutathione lyase
MATIDYAPGVPCWVDLGSPDMEASTSFYGQLFGWQAETSPDPDAGGYTFFRYQGKPVAAGMPLMSGDQPPAWNCYVSVDDAAATGRAVEANGGKVLMAPMEVMGQGTMAMFLDPEGAPFAVWQPAAFAGAGVVNEPNTFCWSELSTRDPEGAIHFYGRVFGWGHETNAFGDSSYTEWKVGGRSIGGMMPMTVQPPDVPPHWAVYFAVEDADAALATAQRLGATPMMPLMSVDIGRFTALTDPQGAAFSIIQLNQA